MKKMYKAMLLVLCAILLVAGSVMGTLAYLQMQTGVVENTFTVGNVAITLDEAKVDEYGAQVGTDRITAATTATGAAVGNKYKLIPGHTYKKDPTVTVKANSEACYVFVKVVNGIEGIEADTTIYNQIIANNWIALSGVDNVYYKAVASSISDTKCVVFESFKLKTDANVADYGNATIEITAYAIQADGFNGDVAAAWTAGGFGN